MSKFPLPPQGRREIIQRVIPAYPGFFVHVMHGDPKDFFWHVLPVVGWIFRTYRYPDDRRSEMREEACEIVDPMCPGNDMEGCQVYFLVTDTYAEQPCSQTWIVGEAAPTIEGVIELARKEIEDFYNKLESS